MVSRDKTLHEKVILHIDGDAFFVGCEIAKNPKLKGLPVVTGEERGIVSALSYEAKALGVVRGMPIFQIKKKFPKVIVLPGDYQCYVMYSRKMFEIVRRYADDVEEYSIDECFADLTYLDNCLYMTYLQIAQRIKKEINEELGLSVSIGLAPTKVLAKVASKWVKPNGLTVIEKKNAPEYLANFSIEKIWGIGPQTSKFLKDRGVRTAGEFVNKELSWVELNLAKPYQTIWYELQGVYIIQLDPEPKALFSSIQKTHSFHPATSDQVFLLSELSKHVEDACRKMRHYKLYTNKFSFFLKTKDFKFYICKVTLPEPTNTPEVIIENILDKFKEVYNGDLLYRTAGVTLQDLFIKKVTQDDLFGSVPKNKKYEDIYSQIDSLESKYGKRVIYLASTSRSLSRQKIGTEVEDLGQDLLFL